MGGLSLAGLQMVGTCPGHRLIAAVSHLRASTSVRLSEMSVQLHEEAQQRGWESGEACRHPTEDRGPRWP